MPKCLGIYIEENLIKYAKVSKERDDLKVESFGIRFFQNLTEEIDYKTLAQILGTNEQALQVIFTFIINIRFGNNINYKRK